MSSDKITFVGKGITIACTDLARSVRFYETTLGAVREPGDGYGCPWFRLGSLVINLMPNAAERTPAEFPVHAMPIVWLEVVDLAAAHQELIRSGVEIVQAPDGQSMMVADPDGLIIEMWQAESEPEVN